MATKTKGHWWMSPNFGKAFFAAFLVPVFLYEGAIKIGMLEGSTLNAAFAAIMTIAFFGTLVLGFLLLTAIDILGNALMRKKQVENIHWAGNTFSGIAYGLLFSVGLAIFGVTNTSSPLAVIVVIVMTLLFGWAALGLGSILRSEEKK